MSVAVGPAAPARKQGTQGQQNGPQGARNQPKPPENLMAGLRRTAKTTPGRLGLIMVGLVVLSLLAGVVGLITVQGRASTLDDLVTSREPFSAAAQQIYRALSDADATQASAFLTSATEPTQLRARYDNDIEAAGAALAVAGSDISGVPGAAKPLSDLAANIPVYTGLVERASANNEQGFPVGSAYLREADNLMQNTLLPAAEKLYEIDSARLSSAQDDATSFPWLAAILTLVLLVALVLAQRYLRRRTNRVLNIGLFVASIAVLVAVLWSAVGMVLESINVDNGQTNGSAQEAVLSRAEIDALKGRTDEMLNLVARGGQDYSGPYATAAKDLGGTDGAGGLLGQARSASGDNTVTSDVDAAINATRSWFDLHNKVTSANQAGDYDTAAGITLGALGAAQNESGTFDKVDGALGQAIKQARVDFTSATNTGSDWLIGLPIGVLVLFVIAAIGATVGIWQRLREYR